MAGSRKKKTAVSQAPADAATTSTSPSSTGVVSPSSPSFSPLTVTLPSTVHSLSDCPVLFTVPLPCDCSLSSIVCSYGFFRLPPNTWIPSNTRLHRLTPLSFKGGVTLSDSGTVSNGCFIRALRFGEREEDAIFVAVTQEETNREDEERQGEQQQAKIGPQLAESKEEVDAATLLTYHTSQQIVVRAIQPPHSLLAALPNSTTAPQRFTFTLSPTSLTQLQHQVCRMLRLSPVVLPSQPNPYHAFYRLVPAAKQRGFARLFRSPTHFEDLLKTISLCNINWAGTIAMNGNFSRLIGLGREYAVEVEVIGILPTAKEAVAGVSSVERSDSIGRSAMSEVMRGGEQTVEAEGGSVRHRLTLGTFPSPWEVASVPDAELREKCRVGYRSQRIVRLGHRFAHENLDQQLTTLLEPSHPTASVYKFLLSLDGFGPFAASNALAMLGRFDSHPFDSETVRHMREHHKFDSDFHLTSDAVLRHAREHYSTHRYGEFVFLVYWHELWLNYEAKVRCRAEEWTQEAFSSFSNGGAKLKQQQAAQQQQVKAEKSHAMRVAEQTRMRKAKGLTATAFNARKRKSAKAEETGSGAVSEELANKENEQPAAEEDVQQPQEEEQKTSAENDGKAVQRGASKRRAGLTLKDMLRSVKQKRTASRKVEAEEPVGGESRRLTRSAARKQSAELVE